MPKNNSSIWIDGKEEFRRRKLLEKKVDPDDLEQFLQPNASANEAQKCVESLQSLSTKKYGSEDSEKQKWMRRLMDNINGFIEIGNSVMHFAPETVQLGWFGVSTVLNAITNNYDLYSFFSTTLSNITEMLVLIGQYDNIYHGKLDQNRIDSPVAKLFEKICDSYVTILEFNWTVRKQLNERGWHKLKHGIKDVFGGRKAEFEDKKSAIDTAKAFMLEYSRTAFEDTTLGDMGSIKDDLSGIQRQISDSLEFQQQMGQLMEEYQKASKFKSISDLARQDFERIKKSLDPLGVSRPTFAALKERRHPGTSKWIFEQNEWQNWYKAEEPAALWITGASGTGKSVLIASILEKLDKDFGESSEYTIQCVSCDQAGDRSSLNGTRIQNTVIFQLYELANGDRNDPILLQECNKLFDSPKRKRRCKALSHTQNNQLAPDLSETVENLAQLLSIKTTIIILDDIGCVGKDEQRNIVAALKDLMSTKKICCKIIISSQPNDPISSQLADTKFSKISMEDYNRVDINLVLTYEIGKIPGWSLQERTDAQTIVKEKTGTLMKYLPNVAIPFLKQPFRRPIASHLEMLPENMNETYRRSWKQLSPASQPLLRWVLQWLLLATEPLRVNELMEAYTEVYLMDLATFNFKPLEETAQFYLDQMREISGLFLKIVEDGHGKHLVQLQDPEAIRRFCISSGEEERVAEAATAEDHGKTERLLCYKCKTQITELPLDKISEKEGHLEIALILKLSWIVKQLNSPIFQNAWMIYDDNEDEDENANQEEEVWKGETQTNKFDAQILKGADEESGNWKDETQTNNSIAQATKGESSTIVAENRYVMESEMHLNDTFDRKSSCVPISNLELITDDRDDIWKGEFQTENSKAQTSKDNGSVTVLEKQNSTDFAIHINGTLGGQGPSILNPNSQIQITDEQYEIPKYEAQTNDSKARVADGEESTTAAKNDDSADPVGQTQSKLNRKKSSSVVGSVSAQEIVDDLSEVESDASMDREDMVDLLERFDSGSHESRSEFWNFQYTIKKWYYHCSEYERLTTADERKKSWEWTKVLDGIEKFLCRSPKVFEAWKNEHIDFSNMRDAKPLHVAARYGLVDVAQRLIEAGADVNAASSNQTPLTAAVLGKDIQMVAILLCAGADPNLVNDSVEEPPFHWVTYVDSSKEMVEVFLKHGASPSKYSNIGTTCLHWFALHGTSVEVLDLLLKNPYNKDDVSDINAPTTDQRETPLHYLTSRDKLPFDLLEAFVERGADVNAEDKHSARPLLVSLKSNDVKALEILLPKTTDIDDTDIDRLTVKWSQTLGRTALHEAAFAHHKGTVELLLKFGANPTYLDNHNRSPLFFACSEPLVLADNSDATALFILHLLEDRNFSFSEVNTPTRGGRTPFRKAAGSGYKSVLEHLLKFAPSKTDIDQQDKVKGQNALHRAAYKGHSQVVKMLVEYGADITLEDNDGNTALDLCYSQWGVLGSTELESTVEILMNYDMRAAVSKEDLLFVAAFNGSVRILEKLFNANVDVTVDITKSDRYGWTPLLLAKQFQHKEAVDLLSRRLTETATKSTVWESTEKKAVKTFDDGTVSYGGRARKCLFAAQPIPPEVTNCYFEVTIKDFRKDENPAWSAKFAIGFSTAKNDQLVFPGSAKPAACTSWAYYAEDGALCSSRSEGPDGWYKSYTTGDTVGAGVDFANGTIFFTYNGKKIPCNPFKNVHGRLFPVLGLKGVIEVETNFGRDLQAKPFRWCGEDIKGITDSDQRNGDNKSDLDEE